MGNRILVLYGSYRSDRMGIRLAHFVVEGFRTRGDDVILGQYREHGRPGYARFMRCADDANRNHGIC